jgi:hypothetical protein
MPSDDDEVSYEVAVDKDGRCLTVSVICKGGLTSEEFGGALVALGQDIISGDIDLNDGRELTLVN